MQVKTRLKLFYPNFSIHHPSVCYSLHSPPTTTHLRPHTQPHTLPYPLPFGVGDEYSRRYQGERNPSGLLELICQVGDPPIPVFNSFWWAPVCHLPVHSVCPKLWLPPQSVFYNDILASHGTLILS